MGLTPLLLADQRPPDEKAAEEHAARVQALVDKIVKARRKLAAKPVKEGWFWSCELVHAKAQLAAAHAGFPRLVVNNG